MTLDTGGTTLDMNNYTFTGPSFVACTTGIAEYTIQCKNCDEVLRRLDQDICPGCKDKLKAKLLFKYKGDPGRPTLYSKLSEEEAIRQWKVKQEKLYADNGTLTFDTTTSDTQAFTIGSGSSTSITGTLQIVTDTNPIVTTKASYRISGA